jgi:hypothetical protein
MATLPPGDQEQPRAATAAVPRAALGVRGAALLVFVGCMGVLGIALYLRPDPRGIGTHEQLFRGPCGLLLTTGYPCPTCGMTTAFAYAVRGQWVRAFSAQPVGLLLCLATVGLALVAARALFCGRWPRIGIIERYPLALMVGFIVVFFAGWGFKLVVGIRTGVFPWGR